MKETRSILRKVLRVTTPEVIGDLTKFSRSRKQVPLTSILEEKMRKRQGFAKILPFEKKRVSSQKSKVKEIVYLAGKRVYIFLKDFIEKEKANEQKLLSAKKGFSDTKAYTETPEFILSEQKKYRASNQSLRFQNSLNVYEKVSETDKIDTENPLKSSTVGNLVDKKSA